MAPETPVVVARDRAVVIDPSGKLQPAVPLTAEEKKRLVEQPADAVTLEETHRALIVAEQQRRAQLPGVANNPDHPWHDDVQPVYQRERLEDQEMREAHLAQNPNHRMQIDNNPAKVMIFIDKTSHSVPPGPMSVADFKRVTKLTGAIVATGGVLLNDENASIRLFGGESFHTDRV